MRRDQRVQSRLSRAQEDLGGARLTLMHEHLHAAVSLLYLACFHAVGALLRARGSTAKTDARVKQLFAERWIKTNQLPASLGRFYDTLFDLQHQIDFGGPTSFERTYVQDLAARAQEFVETISEKAREALGEKGKSG